MVVQTDNCGHSYVDDVAVGRCSSEIISEQSCVLIIEQSCKDNNYYNFSILALRSVVQFWCELEMNIFNCQSCHCHDIIFLRRTQYAGISEVVS